MECFRVWKKCVAIGLVLILLFTGSYNGSTVQKAYAAEVWIEITDAAGLNAIRNNLSANYKLMADIDLNSAAWTPIGSAGSPFVGKLDGNSKIIRNLSITDTTKTNQGLFSVVGNGGEVKNLGIEGANITAANNTGILAGMNTGIVSRCFTKGSVSGQDYVGGLVGQNSGNIQNSFTQASVSGKDYFAGLAGSNTGTVQNSYASSALSTSVFNNYLDFNGVGNTGGYVDIAHKDIYVQNQFTLEAWFQWDDVGTADVNFIIGKGYEQFEIHTGGGAGVNGLRFIPVWNEGGDSWIDVKNVIQPGWFHVAAVYDYNDSLDQAAARVYVNGIPQDLWRGATNMGKTATLGRSMNTLGHDKVNGVMVPKQYNINIGRRTDQTFYFDGKISDVRFWSIARTEMEIKRDKDKALTGTEPGLVGYWRLNEASGDALDSTANNNNGMLIGNVARTSIAAASNKGGLIGQNTGTVSNSYYDSGVSGQSDDTGKGTPVTTGNMKIQSTFNTWDFVNIWGMNPGSNNGYPCLLSTSKDITAFSFQGLTPAVTGTINSNTGTITLNVPFGTDVTALVPTIVHTGISINPSSGEAKDFTGNVTYTVTAQDGSAKSYTVKVQSEFAGGDGSTGDPYRITKLEHLNNMRNHMDKNFILMNDLDFNTDSDYLDTANKAAWTTGEGWLPIGTNLSRFTGALNGNGHIIKNLYINRPGTEYVGLFGVAGAVIKSLGLVDVNIKATRYIGALAGWQITSDKGIDSCFATGSIEGITQHVGGLVGGNDGSISNSYTIADVKAGSSYAGGVAGGTDTSGGSITNCFAAGKVYGLNLYIGGVTGYCGSSSTITNSYYNSTVTGQTGGYGTGIATIQMKQQASFSGFDFSGVWDIHNGITFPYLRWQASRTDRAWPAFKNGSASITNVGVSGMDLHVETDERGKVYYVVLPASGTVPTEQEIKNGTGSGGSAPVAHGSFNITADIEAVKSIVDLPQNNSYKICIVTEDDEGSLQMKPDVLTVNLAASAPTINTQPASVSKNVGQTANFTVAASIGDGASVSYQWQKSTDGGANWSYIDGATGTSYTTGLLALSDSGSQYRLSVIMNRNSTASTSTTATSTTVTTATAVSNAATLTVLPLPVAPTITTQPANVTSAVGYTATFTIVASASDGGTITYQWQSYEARRWTVIVGATSSSYTTPTLTSGNTGKQYRCLVYNSKNGTTTSPIYSNTVTLTVGQPGVSPIIVTQPESLTKDIGQTATFTVAANTSDGGVLSYRWEKSTDNGVSWNSIAGAESSSYTTPELVFGDNGTKYRCVVTNSKNGTTANINSDAATLTVNPAPIVPPLAPNIHPAVPGDSKVTISWEPVADATEYKVFKSTVSGMYDAAEQSVSGSVYSCEIGGLSNGTTYYFVVRSAKEGIESANSDQVVATPLAASPGMPSITTVTEGDRHVYIGWSSVTGASGYKIFSSLISGQYGAPVETVTNSVYGYDITGLINGTTYYFVVAAVNAGGDTYSGEISAIPKTVPGAPTNVIAVAGNGQAAISFNAPADNGGSPITSYVVTSTPGGITATGSGTSITVTGLTNGTAYTFTVKAVNGAGQGQESLPSNQVVPSAPSSSGSSNSTTTPTTPAAPAKPTQGGIDILVNGKTETAATSTTSVENNKTVTTVAVDGKKVEEKLQSEGNKATVTIPVNNKSDVVVGQLSGQTVKNMEAKEAVLEIKTEEVKYTLPAAQINIDSVSEKLGKEVELKDIVVNVKISAPPQDTVKIVEDTANRNNYQIVVKPVEFEISCTHSDKSVSVSKFNGFVERTVAIPEGVDPGKITTGIVLNTDGSFSHVPTSIVMIDGKYHAKINSLTNSTYSVIWNQKNFKDVESHWSREAVNDMASRLIISGIDKDTFAPDEDITRAEFTAIAVRALGLRNAEGNTAFTDVENGAWYYDNVRLAVQYGLISGYNDGTLKPDKKITREEAMAIIARVMKIVKMEEAISEKEVEQSLSGFSDGAEISAWAKSPAALCISKGIINGSFGRVNAKDNITRAETAVIIKRLLQKANLI